MKKLILIFALIPLMAFAQYGQRGAGGGGSTFYWSLTGQAQKTDSLRIIQGSNMTITQSGNTITFNGAAGAGSTANVRANTGWTSNGTTAQDTLATYYLINGKFQRQMWVDTDNDSVIIAPHALFPLAGKDATSLLFAFDSTGRLGLNALTSAQARRAMFNILGRAANDTLLVFSNDGGGVVGDSSAMMNGAGEWGFGTGPSSGFRLNVSGHVQASNFYAVSTVRIAGSVMLSGSNPLKVGEQATTIEITPTSTGFIGLGTNTAGQRQAFVTIRTQTPTADTTFMVRNNKTSATDSTVFFTATGDIDAGGNNFYLGGHRIRSNASGDSLIFYDGNTMIFAILSDGSTADLVAGTPPASRRYIPPPDYIWLLRIGVLLLLLLVAFKVYDYLKPFIRKHKTLPGEI